MKIKYGDADHVVSVYRLENSKGPFKQGFVEDGENGAGLRILEVMKEKESEKLAIHVARYHSGVKMGPRRFDIYKDLAKKAIKTAKQKQAKLDRVNRLHRSSSQLSQLSQLSAASNDSFATPSENATVEEGLIGEAAA